QQVTDSLSLVGAEFEKEDSAKLNMLDTMLNQIISSGDKVIVFSRFREMVDLLKERYKMYNPAVVHGDISSSGRSEKTVIRELKSAYGEEWFNNLSPEEKKRILDYETASDRQKEVYKFQGDDSCKLFIGCTP